MPRSRHALLISVNSPVNFHLQKNALELFPRPLISSVCFFGEIFMTKIKLQRQEEMKTSHTCSFVFIKVVEKHFQVRSRSLQKEKKTNFEIFPLKFVTPCHSKRSKSGFLRFFYYYRLPSSIL